MAKRGDPFGWAIRVSSVVLSGVFYPTSVMPDWLHTISQLLPLTHALELIRRSLLNGEGWAELRGDLLALCLARLQAIAPGCRRVGLSATVAWPDALRAWLAPDATAGSADLIQGGESVDAQVGMLTTREPMTPVPPRLSIWMVSCFVSRMKNALLNMFRLKPYSLVSAWGFASSSSLTL